MVSGPGGGAVVDDGSSTTVGSEGTTLGSQGRSCSTTLDNSPPPDPAINPPPARRAATVDPASLLGRRVLQSFPGFKGQFQGLVKELRPDGRFEIEFEDGLVSCTQAQVVHTLDPDQPEPEAEDEARQLPREFARADNDQPESEGSAEAGPAGSVEEAPRQFRAVTSNGHGPLATAPEPTEPDTPHAAVLEPAELEGWRCKLCTLINPADKDQCGACTSKRRYVDSTQLRRGARGAQSAKKRPRPSLGAATKMPARRKPSQPSPVTAVAPAEPAAAVLSVVNQQKLLEVIAERKREENSEFLALMDDGKLIQAQWLASAVLRAVEGAAGKLHSFQLGLSAAVGVPAQWGLGCRYIANNLVTSVAEASVFLPQSVCKLNTGVAIARHSNCALPPSLDRTLFSTQHFEIGQVIGVYAGLYSLDTQLEDRTYGMEIEALGIVVCPDQCGNELKYLNAAPKDRREMANVKFDVAEYNSRLQPVVRAIRNIDAGEELLGSYPYED